MTAAEDHVIRLVLADLPADAASANLSAARPLGDRAAVVARLKDLLPGLTFDDQGRGTFARGGYTIRFTLTGEQPDLIDVELDKPEAFAPIKRIVDRTRWRPIEPEALGFIDLDASKSVGAIVLVDPSAEPEAPDAGRDVATIVKRAAVAVVAVAVLWGAWQYASTRPDRMSPAAVARTQHMADEALRWAAERARRRMALMRAIAPQFRANPVVLQLFDAWVASIDYRAGFGMGRFAKIENLSDEGFWARFQMPPQLPAEYLEAEREGYLFEFIGEHCGPMPNNMSAPPDDCDEFIYMARPLDTPERKGVFPPSFALFSEDGRIHVRANGEVPSLQDPTVDTVDAPVAPAGESTGFFAGIGRSITGLLERLVGPSTPSAASIAGSESAAIKDLRAVAQAETVLSAMLGGEKYVPPEMLADAKLFRRANLPPLLPAYFAQPMRLGYVFEFEGAGLTVSPDTFSWLSEVYGSFVYVARPTQPEGRRTFAVFSDGLIYSTTEDRTPTREDTPLGAQ